MSSPVPQRKFTFREYLELEEVSNTKHEFAQGEIFAMAGGTPEHAALSMAMGALLVPQLRNVECRVYSSDLRIRVEETGLTTYPDVTVVCGEAKYDAESSVTVTNPSLVVEVLSPSTEDYDRGEKLDHYQKIAALKACLLIAQDRPLVELVLRTAAGWERFPYGASDTVPLPLHGATFGVHELYDIAGLRFDR
ncbi:MAG: Uma2 family endonuclease [Myxococcota bacterium]